MYTIRQAREALDTKKISAVELTRACLEKIKQYNDKFFAFITICEDVALKQAAEADALIAQGKTFPLLGIPYSLKDIFSTTGIRTTAGSTVLKEYVAVYDATCYARLQSQHAVLLGKTNCDAWGHGSSTENSDFGPSRNPFDPFRVPGGSTGGSAVAIACGMGLFSIGGDTGGSIRLPAAFCNITGLKVSYGRVSRYGAIAFSSSLDTVGPMAKTVDDCQIVLAAIAGKDEHDATTIPESFVPAEYTSVKGLKIGLPKEFFGSGIEPVVRETVEKAAKTFESLGAVVREVSIPTMPYAIAAYYLINPSETSSNLARYDGIRYGFDRSKLGTEAKRRIMIGTYALSAGYYDQYYLKAQKVRTILRNEYQKAFTDVDMLLAPVSPTVPFKIGEKANDPMAMYLSDVFTVSINPVGIPSLAVPCGFSPEGLPIGMQLIGPQKGEAILFNAGHAYEEVHKWYDQKPTL